MNQEAATNEESHGRYVRRHAQTDGHMRVSFNPFANVNEVIAARTELLEWFERTQLTWALRYPPAATQSTCAEPAAAPLLVLVCRLKQQWPEFAAFEAKYLNRAARRKHLPLMRFRFITDASIISKTFKRLEKKWHFDSPFIVNLPRDFVRAQPEQSPLPTKEFAKRNSRPAMRFKWRFDLTHPQNYRRW